MDEIEKLFEASRGDRLHPIIDSAMTAEEALRLNPEKPAPPEILERQRVIIVKYYSFDNKVHQGQVVIDQDLVAEVEKLFEIILEERFPVTSVIPVSHPDIAWNDDISMKQDNSSGFNYRTIANKEQLSQHAYGRAIDLNPRLNPYFASGEVYPKGATYDTSVAGTLHSKHAIVKFMKACGWEWGGDWKETPDYQHFQKKLPNNQKTA